MVKSTRERVSKHSKKRQEKGQIRVAVWIDERYEKKIKELCKLTLSEKKDLRALTYLAKKAIFFLCPGPMVEGRSIEKAKEQVTNIDSWQKKGAKNAS